MGVSEGIGLAVGVACTPGAIAEGVGLAAGSGVELAASVAVGCGVGEGFSAADWVACTPEAIAERVSPASTVWTAIPTMAAESSDGAGVGVALAGAGAQAASGSSRMASKPMHRIFGDKGLVMNSLGMGNGALEAHSREAL